MKLFYSLIIFTLLLGFSYAESLRGLEGYQPYTIDAAKNARAHNNMGNIYFDEKNYNAALSEYQIAYNLTKDTTAGAPYIYNIARCMIKLGNYQAAQYAIKQAIAKDCINMVYYDTLVDCYIKLNIAPKELQKCLEDDKNPYNRIVAGLIYLKTGEKINAKIIFDEFINNNPDMIISDDVRRLLRDM
ncbi:tetratricopeptide repeat protein [bacterium]|nr:tetratricopeptide repeat protein [bacterium]